jgi:hypothetical protein
MIYYTYFSIVKHNIADMGRKKEMEELETATVEVRNVGFDQEIDAAVDTWRAKQKSKGQKFKRGQAVVELTIRGLKAEGII